MQLTIQSKGNKPKISIKSVILNNLQDLITSTSENNSEPSHL